MERPAIVIETIQVNAVVVRNEDMRPSLSPVDQGLGEQAMRRLAHVIEATEVTAVERRLEDALEAAGFNVRRLNLTPLAQQVAAEKANELLVAVNIQPVEAPFFGRGDGGVEVRFVFGTETDLVMAQTVLA